MQLACLIALGVVLCLWYIHNTETKNKHWFKDTVTPIAVRVSSLCMGEPLHTDEIVTVLEQTDEEPLLGEPVLRKVIINSKSFYCIIERKDTYRVSVLCVEIPNVL